MVILCWLMIASRVETGSGNPGYPGQVGPRGMTLSGNCVRDFKSPWFLTWFLISKLWFLISKLISYSSHKPNINDYILPHLLFKLPEAWIVISLICLRKASHSNLAPYWVLVEFRAWQKLSQKLRIENRISSSYDNFHDHHADCRHCNGSYIKLIAPDFKVLEITLVCVNFPEEAVILYAWCI